MGVYMIRVGDAGPVKIGVAVRIDFRIISLQTSHWEKLHLIRTLEGSYAEESWLHTHYRKQRIRGEWFHYSEDMLSITVPDFTSDPQFVRAATLGTGYFSSAQCRVGRTVLKWTVRDMAEKADIAPNTVTNFERGHCINSKSKTQIQKTLEAEGVVFDMADGMESVLWGDNGISYPAIPLSIDG